MPCSTAHPRQQPKTGEAEKVSRIVDLSVPIDAETQLYPGDPQVKFTQSATIERDGFNLLGVEMGSQSGTNCDAPNNSRRTRHSAMSVGASMPGPAPAAAPVDGEEISSNARYRRRPAGVSLYRQGPAE